VNDTVSVIQPILRPSTPPLIDCRVRSQRCFSVDCEVRHMMSSPWIIEVINGALTFEEIQGGCVAINS
jgi:hypothetical protein